MNLKLICPKQRIKDMWSILRKAPVRKLFFILGLICNFLVFALPYDKQIRIPWISQKAYRKVNALMEGFNKVCGLPIDIEDVNEHYRQTVYGDLKLYPNDKGFTELSSFILADLRRAKPEYLAQISGGGTMSFEIFKQNALRDGFSKMIYSGFPGNRTGEQFPIGNNRINVYLNNSSNRHEDYYAVVFVHALEKGIEKERKWAASIGTVAFYLPGLCIQLFLFNWRNSNKQDITPKRTMSPYKWRPCVARHGAKRSLTASSSGDLRRRFHAPCTCSYDAASSMQARSRSTESA